MTFVMPLTLMADRPSSDDVWDRHRVAIVFVTVVFGITVLFTLILLLLKCLERRRESAASVARVASRDEEDRTGVPLHQSTGG